MNPAEIANAKAICASGCPARSSCLLWALLEPEGWGVWGGYTRPERAKALAACGGDANAVVEALEAGTLDELIYPTTPVTLTA